MEADSALLATSDDLLDFFVFFLEEPSPLPSAVLFFLDFVDVVEAMERGESEAGVAAEVDCKDSEGT